MEIFSIILLILFVCRIFGEVSERVGQPALVGELFAGIFLGVVLKHYGHYVGLSLDFVDDHAFKLITELGIFFLMLLAGLELHPKQMSQASKDGIGIALGGLMLPLVMGYMLGQAVLPESDLKMVQSLFLGTALAITAVPVVVRVLLDFDKLDTRIGRCVVSTAVIDDILSLMVLAVLTGFIQNGTMPSWLSIGVLSIKVICFFVVCYALGKFVFPTFSRMLKKGQVDEGDFSGVLLMGFGFALLAELFGLHFIIGAFFAGLIFQRTHTGDKMFNQVEKKVYGITSGFLAPIFFASIGLHVTFGAVVETPLFTTLLIVVAVLGKVLGAGIPAYYKFRDVKSAAVIGTAMNGRGAVELIIVDIALKANLFDGPEPVPPILQNMFSAIVIMAIVTTVMTPILLRPMLRHKMEGD